MAGTAYNGVEGMELIRREKPDMLISDICMPKMDGLAMIAALKSEFPDMEITILTGYRDFDYAQQSIRLGVCRFLLKPSKMDELNEAIRAMLERLEEKAPLREEDFSEERAESGEQEEKEELESAASSFIVKNALAFIGANYAERLKLADVADNVYVSQWHLSKLLNKYTGQNFSEILNHVRMEKAKELLDLLTKMGEEKKATMGQLSLAWMINKKPYLIPIPGSRKIERLKENFEAGNVVLTKEEIAMIDSRLDTMDFDVFGGHSAK